MGSSQGALCSSFGGVRVGGFGYAAKGRANWDGLRGAEGAGRAGGWVGYDHLALERVADGNGAALLPELCGEGADHRVESVLGGVRVVEAGDQRLEGGVDAPPSEGGALALCGQVEQAQGGVRVDLQRLVPMRVQGGGEAEAAAGQDLDQRGGQDRDAHVQQIPLQLPAASARIVAAGAIVVEATAAGRTSERGVDRERGMGTGHSDEGQDLVVSGGAAEQFQAAMAEQRDAGLAVWQAGQVDAEAGAQRPSITSSIDHKDARTAGGLGSFLDFYVFRAVVRRSG